MGLAEELPQPPEPRWCLQGVGQQLQLLLLRRLTDGSGQPVGPLGLPPDLLFLPQRSLAQLAGSHPLQIDEGRQHQVDPVLNLLELLEPVPVQAERRFELFEEKLNLPAIMPPKSGTYIGPPRAATQPPSEGRSCSSLTRCPEL